MLILCKRANLPGASVRCRNAFLTDVSTAGKTAHFQPPTGPARVWRPPLQPVWRPALQVLAVCEKCGPECGFAGFAVRTTRRALARSFRESICLVPILFQVGKLPGMRLLMPMLRPKNPCKTAALALALVFCAAASWLPAQTAPAPGVPQAAPPRPAPTPEQLAIQAASEKDHQRMMDLLGIKELRPGASGSANGPNPANYDESKANIYPNLPDPLVLKDGKRVTTAKVWWKERRPQLVELFDREILGRVPAHLPAVTWKVVSTTQEKNGDIPVITKTLVGHVDNASDPAINVDIEVTLTTPAEANGPVPVMIELTFSRQFIASIARMIPEMAPGANQGPTWQQQVLSRGWGYAEYAPTSVQPDNGAGLVQGIIGLANKGQPRALDDWGALRAWAWGASRVLDYLATDPAVDARQVGITGHSRYGKAALVAMAYDPRFAIGYISSSGEAGSKLYRHHFGEEIGNIAGTSEYHWMDGNFLRYDGPLTVADLPVDAHELIALCAPRPVFIGGGATKGDGWADAEGSFLAAVAAGPVYRLLGKKDLGTSEFPPIETALISGDLGFRQHTGGHTPAPNWPTFLEFASRYLHAPAAKAP